MDGRRPNRDLICPAGHSGDFTQYGLSLYKCHRCGPYMFTRLPGGKPRWVEPEKVPPGLRAASIRGREIEEMASRHAKTLVSKTKKVESLLTMSEAIAALREMRRKTLVEAATEFETIAQTYSGETYSARACLSGAARLRQMAEESGP